MIRKLPKLNFTFLSIVFSAILAFPFTLLHAEESGQYIAVSIPLKVAKREYIPTGARLILPGRSIMQPVSEFLAEPETAQAKALKVYLSIAGEEDRDRYMQILHPSERESDNAEGFFKNHLRALSRGMDFSTARVLYEMELAGQWLYALQLKRPGNGGTWNLVFAFESNGDTAYYRRESNMREFDSLVTRAVRSTIEGDKSRQFLEVLSKPPRHLLNIERNKHSVALQVYDVAYFGMSVDDAVAQGSWIPSQYQEALHTFIDIRRALDANDLEGAYTFMDPGSPGRFPGFPEVEPERRVALLRSFTVPGFVVGILNAHPLYVMYTLPSETPVQEYQRITDPAEKQQAREQLIGSPRLLLDIGGGTYKLMARSVPGWLYPDYFRESIVYKGLGLD